VDYTEFRKTMREKYAKADERQERRRRWLRGWLYASLMLFAAIVLAFIAFRLTR
jgi:hypothetical protein